MIRTQISLVGEQLARLRDAAERRGVSVAAVVREAVEAYLDRDPDDLRARHERIWSVVGSCADSATDVAERHDHYVAEAIATEHE